MELRQDSCIHGYHVIWNAVLGQVLLTKGELAMQSGRDRHAVAVSSKKHSCKTVPRAPTKKKFEVETLLSDTWSSRNN